VTTKPGEIASFKEEGILKRTNKAVDRTRCHLSALS